MVKLYKSKNNKSGAKVLWLHWDAPFSIYLFIFLGKSSPFNLIIKEEQAKIYKKTTITTSSFYLSRKTCKPRGEGELIEEVSNRQVTTLQSPPSQNPHTSTNSHMHMTNSPGPCVNDNRYP